MAALQLSLNDGTYSNFPYVKWNPLSIYHHPSETHCSSSFQGGDRLFSTYHLIIHLSPFEMNMPAYKYKLVCK